MKTNTSVRRLCCLGLLTLGMGLAGLPVAKAQVPRLLNYQGRLIIGGTNYHGVVPFKFALVDGAGATTYWSNDGSSAEGGEPSAAVPLEVNKGLYTVLLGDTTLPNMLGLSPAIFDHDDVRLRVWVQDDGATFKRLTPDQRVAAVGYALMAADVADNSITAQKLSVAAVGTGALADNAVTTAKLANGAVTTAKLAASSLTLNPGAGLTGGGAVALGGMVSLGVANGGIGPTQLAASAVQSAHLTDGAVTTTKLAAGAVDNTKLANPSLTVTAGNGLTGGGAVSLGAATTLSLAEGGVTSAKLASEAASLGKVSAGALALAQATNLTVAGNLSAYRFVGDGLGLSNVVVIAGNVAGRLGVEQLPANVLTNGDGGSGELSAALNSHTTASGFGSTAMGHFTEASGWASFSMGHATKASSDTAVALGWGNTASGAQSTAMGLFTTASGYHSTAMGYRAKAIHNGSLVWADAQDADFGSTAANQFLIRAGGGVGINTTNPQTALHVGGTITATGNLAFPATAGPDTGVITLGGVPALHMYGSQNCFVGESGNFSMTGTYNTGNGRHALSANAEGSQNTATGYYALGYNTGGNYNTAYGSVALGSNTTGLFNTAQGAEALRDNTTGGWNTANGGMALLYNLTGNHNTAAGFEALLSNRTGSYNVALGRDAGYWLINGSGNLFVGSMAGYTLTNGSNNILIGNPGVPAEFGTIRIGNEGTHTATFIAGIIGATVSAGTPVLVATNGQLGTRTSSARFKQNIRDMGAASDVVMALRPVTFEYRADLDPAGLAQYGLVAEEVQKVAPVLVLRDACGAPYTVRYDAVNAMLLNEVQKQHRELKEQERTLAELKSANALLETRLATLELRLKTMGEPQPDSVSSGRRVLASDSASLP